MKTQNKILDSLCIKYKLMFTIKYVIFTTFPYMTMYSIIKKKNTQHFAILLEVHVKYGPQKFCQVGLYCQQEVQSLPIEYFFLIPRKASKNLQELVPLPDTRQEVMPGTPPETLCISKKQPGLQSGFWFLC